MGIPMGIPAQPLRRWRRSLPAIALIFGLMAVALSCGGSAEQMAMESAAAPLSDDDAVASAPASASGGQSYTETVEDSGMAAEPTAAPQIASAAAATTAPAAARQERASDGAASSSVSAQTAPQAGRQLIVEAWITLQVDAIDPVARQVEAVAAQRGGWVESADILGEAGYRTASISIRIPAARFDETMIALRALGATLDEGVSSQDVTDRLIDNEARMTAWRAQEERLIVLLENAATVEDVIDIERRISEVRADIEHIAATQRNLQGRVAASLIRVNLHLPPRFASDPPAGQMTLAVGDPPAAGDAIIARVESLNGYIGQKREYRQGQGDAVELTAFVRAADLPGLMDYAATLGEIADRRLDSVGPSPESDAPNARLTLTIHSNVDSAATLSLSTDDAIAVAGQIRAYAEERGGYVESWREVRHEDGDIIDLGMLVKAADLRAIMDYGATLGEPENWEYQSVGQSPTDSVPNARLTLSVFTDDDQGISTPVIAGAVVAAVAVVAVIVVVVALARRRQSAARSDADAGAGSDAGAGVLAREITARRQPPAPDAAGDDAGADGNGRP